MSRGGGSSSNNAIIAQQREEAAQAQRDKQDRDERMRYGREKIRAAFRGGTVGPYKSWQDLPTFSERRNIVGYTTPRSLSPQDIQIRRERGVAVPGPQPIYGGTEQYQTGTERQFADTGETETLSGIGDDFYNNYYKTITDYYNPQLDEQYKDAKSQNLFNLARRGLLRSSQAAEDTAQVEQEYGDAKLDIANRAQGQRDQLVRDVNTAETNALAMLEGAENPSSGIDAALREATAIQTRAPDLSGGLGNVFSAALNAYNNYNAVRNAKSYRDAITPRSPTQSSGRRYG